MKNAKVRQDDGRLSLSGCRKEDMVYHGKERRWRKEGGESRDKRVQ